MLSELEKYITWFSSADPPKRYTKVCASRDSFQSRLDEMYRQLSADENTTDAALLVAIIGELGNNCFDHNLGQWRDISGCLFDYEQSSDDISVLISDRGQGIFASLKRVISELKDDSEALEVAFSKYISGRSPERRGNGLKFVRSVINGNKKRGLFFVSGNASISLGGLGADIENQLKSNAPIQGTGTFAMILWKA
jgi:hypothetical protein